MQQINGILLYLQVSRLSDIVTKDGSDIEEWSKYGQQRATVLKWPKRRKPLAVNMKFWRETLQVCFYERDGIYPRHLGPELVQPISRDLLSPVDTFTSILHQYPHKYISLLGKYSIEGARYCISYWC